jgi:hypothetical protein
MRCGCRFQRLLLHTCHTKMRHAHDFGCRYATAAQFTNVRKTRVSRRSKQEPENASCKQGVAFSPVANQRPLPSNVVSWFFLTATSIS